MATPRHQLVDPERPLFYHLVSRCVRRSWLCGFDRASRRDYRHRKDWLVQRLKQLSGAFALDVYAYAIMSNHFHLVIYYDPNAPDRWSGSEVADRWLRVCPPKLPDGGIDESMRELLRDELLADREKLESARQKLGSLSVFMKFLKQPIARRANLEDDVTGHFFEQRFHSGALLSEKSVLAAMAYVDLNPIRAKIARSIETSEHTSIHERLENDQSRIQEYLRPISGGVNATPPFDISLAEYIDRLEVLTPRGKARWKPSKLNRWREQVAILKKRQRVYGPEALIKEWIKRRGWQPRELPLPD